MPSPDLATEPAEQFDELGSWSRRKFLGYTCAVTAGTSICGAGFLLHYVLGPEQIQVEGYLVETDLRRYILDHVEGINENPELTNTDLLHNFSKIVNTAYTQTFPNYLLGRRSLESGIRIVNPDEVRKASEAQSLFSINEPLPPVITFFNNESKNYRTFVAPYSAIFERYLGEGKPGNTYLELLANACSYASLPQKDINSGISLVGFRLDAPGSNFNGIGEIINAAIANLEQRMLLVQGLGLVEYNNATSQFDKATEVLLAIAKSNQVELTELLLGHRNSDFSVLNRALNLGDDLNKLTEINKLLIDLTNNPDLHPDLMAEFNQINMEN